MTTKTKIKTRMMKRWRVAESYEATPRIDVKKGIIYNVLVLGMKSKNLRRYTVEAMEEALNAGLYENLQVYIGPHKKHRWAKRSPNNHAGELRNSRLTKDGIRADLYYNRTSRGGQLALEIAERFHKHFGLSHHALVDGYEENGEKIVTQILEVAVADIVKDPATTTNVFEDASSKPKKGKPVEVKEDDDSLPVTDATQTDDDEEDSGGWAATIKQLIGEIHDDDDIEDDVKMKATKMAMKLKALLNGDSSDSSDDNDDEDDDKPKDSDESVKMENRLFNRLKKLVAPAKQQAGRRSTITPRSAARTTVTEDVTQTPKSKPAVLKTRQEVIDAYSED